MKNHIVIVLSIVNHNTFPNYQIKVTNWNSSLPARIPLTTTGRLVMDLSHVSVSHVRMGSICASNRPPGVRLVIGCSKFGNLKSTNSSCNVSSSPQKITRRLYCVEWTQYSIRPKRSAICNRCFPGPTRVLNTNGISIASVLFARLTRWQTDWQTNRPRYAVGNNKRSQQCRSQILLLSISTTSIYWSSRLTYTMPAFLRKRSPDGATRNWGRRHPIASYLYIDPIDILCSSCFEIYYFKSCSFSFAILL